MKKRPDASDDVIDLTEKLEDSLKKLHKANEDKPVKVTLAST